MHRREIGPYRLLCPLGAGGMGEVYLAERFTPGAGRRRCCVKLMLPHLARRQEIAELFEREAVLSARVNHENVVRVFDYGRIDDVFYLAMEYIDGVTARRMLNVAQEKRVDFSVAGACAIAVDVARGLAAVHTLKGDDGKPLGVVHRDVTPDNILVTRDGLAKLGDFGIAIAEDSTRITQTGELRGKMPYMSPEQLDGGAVGPPSDVFMLGVTLFQLVTGRRPFDRGTDLGTMNAIVGEAAPPLDGVRKDVPRPLSSLVASMLEKDPRNRPRSPELPSALLSAVPEALQRPRGLVQLALSASEITMVAPEPQTSVTEPSGAVASLSTQGEPRPRHWAAAIGVGAALAIAAGTAAYMFAIVPEDHSAIATATARAHTTAQPDTTMDEQAVAPVPTPALPVESRETEPTTAARSPTQENVPTLHLIGPSNVRWFSTKGRALGSGDLRVKLAAKSVIAVDIETGGRSVVPVVAGSARYDALGMGTLDVRAEPYAEVSIGARNYGITPLKPAPQLVEGTYRVKLVCEGREKIEVVEVRANQTARVRADLSGS